MNEIQALKFQIASVATSVGICQQEDCDSKLLIKGY